MAITSTILLGITILSFTSLKVSAKGEASIKCGTTDFSRSLITKGTKTVRGEWPFLTALFVADQNMFFCSGSLISSRHVLTAAHCIRQKDSSWSVLPSDIFALLGAYDLTLKNERDVQQMYIEEIYVHSEWQVRVEKYDADLAILQLSELVSFTNYIRPVCLPTYDFLFDNVTGSVVGWGYTEIKSEPNKEFIKHSAVTALNSAYCYTEDYIVAIFSSPRTFCGRGKNGNPNSGDSGGGFYVLLGSTWVQYGIVSTLRTNATGFVDDKSIVVYTNVLKFINWIADIVNQSGLTVGEAQTNIQTKIHLQCLFGDFIYEITRYGCAFHELNITSDNVAVASFIGSHVGRKTDEDVEVIRFYSGTMFFIPSGIGQFFRNVNILEVGESLNLKRIKRSAFQSLQNLVRIEIEENNITKLDYDSFRDLQRLERFNVKFNPLTQIDGRTFETNVQLKEVELRNNNITALPSNIFTNNLLLEIVYLNDNVFEMINGTTFQTNVKLKEVLLYKNRIAALPSDLFKNNLLLEIIRIDSNSLSMIDGSTFEMNVKLRVVNLSFNKIEILPSNLFAKNVRLGEVTLNDNHLKMIDGTTFERNLILKQVDLHNNKLEFLPSRLFANNLLLELVDLRQNSLKRIKTEFSHLQIVKVIYLTNNVCIDAEYGPSKTRWGNEFTDLTVFQKVVSVSCG